MIIVSSVVNFLFSENTYIVFSNETKSGVIIDPGSDFEKILSAIENIKIEAVLLTHGHFDHTASCAKLQKLGYKMYISNKDEIMCSNLKANSSADFGYKFETFSPDFLIDKNQTLIFNDLEVKVLECGGHSKGGVSYIIGNNLFSGDTIFHSGYGRTDLYGGNSLELRQSIRLLREYVKNGYNLYPGHDV